MLKRFLQILAVLLFIFVASATYMEVRANSILRNNRNNYESALAEVRSVAHVIEAMLDSYTWVNGLPPDHAYTEIPKILGVKQIYTDMVISEILESREIPSSVILIQQTRIQETVVVAVQ